MQTASFTDFLLKKELNRAIIDCGFEHPSEVQHECIPYAIEGRDIICQAVSGMGKTAVFVLSVLNNLDEQPKPVSAIILCNTRELAIQIKDEISRFTKYLENIRTEAFFGGVPISGHEKILKSLTPPHIVVGTPGRVLALADRKVMALDNLKMFVLDECDKMLDETDMRAQVQKIFMASKVQRQVMMFSATLSGQTKETCKKFMKDPFELYIDSESKLNLHGLKQYYVKLAENEKIRKLIDLLDTIEFNQVIIFTKSQDGAKKLNEIMQKEKFPSVACCRSLPMEQRKAIYQGFRQGKYRIMISTDLLGRGIDIEKINIVVNFDMPTESDQYLHRVGRAGRFNTKGLGISFISNENDEKILAEVQSRFETKVEDLPPTIDKSTYMNN